jgi:hypothetical protein
MALELGGRGEKLGRRTHVAGEGAKRERGSSQTLARLLGLLGPEPF